MIFDWINEADQENSKNKEILSFKDYMEILNQNAYNHCRPTYRYILDMLDHYGKNEKGQYSLFEKDLVDAPAVYGQSRVEEAFVQNLHNFEEEGFNNKFILLVGPNGSSKSSLVKKIISGMESYSELEEGSLYTFSWIFPIDNYIKGTLGLGPSKAQSELKTFAYLEDNEISAILSSELKDDPLLLVPNHHRKKLIDDLLADRPEYLESIKKSYLYNGDLSKRNRLIYDALLKNYKGHHEDVLRHIRIERFKVSRRYSTAAVTIEPQLHVDARVQQITMDRRLSTLPPSLQSLNLFSLQGEAILANRGILEFSDLLKRPLDTFKYLLMTMETRNVNLQGILTELDICFMGTSNEVHLAAFKQHPDFNSFKGRFNFIRVPYLLEFTEEEKIYTKQIEGLKEKSIFEPYALRALCLFSVMTRLRSPQAKRYEDKKLSEIVTQLNPLEKASFIDSKEIPAKFDSESRQILEQNYEAIRSEFEHENLYEGKFGISPRDMKNIIYKLASRHKNITFIEIIDYLLKLITKKNEYDFLNMTPQADYHHPARFIALIKEYCIEKVDREVRDSLGLVDERIYEDYIKKYVEHVTAFLKGEKIKNTITGRYEESSDYFITEFEKNIDLKENKEKFRSHILSKLGAYSLDNPGKEWNFMQVFPDLVQSLQQSFRTEQKKVLQTIAKNLVFYRDELEKPGSSSLSAENLSLIQAVIDKLQTSFGHSQNGALAVLKYIIKEKY